MNSAPAPARFFLLRYATWLAAGIVLATLLAWLSIKLQVAGFAPVGLFSLLLGAALGGGLTLLLSALGNGQRLALLAGTALLAIVTTLGQFWFAHREYVAQTEAGIRKNPKGAFFLDQDEGGVLPGFQKWLRAKAREEWTITYWITDGALVTAAALAVVWFATKGPYCNGCRSWYRTSRSGPLSRAAGAELALAADCPLPAAAEGIEYRLISCRTGCGPARIELSWKEDGHERRSRHWIDHAARTQIEAQLNSWPAS